MPQATWIKITADCVFQGQTPMPLPLLPASLSKYSQKDAIPYSGEAVWQDLTRVRISWQEAEADRSRDAIYGYLAAVYALVTWWAADGQDSVRAQRGVRLSGAGKSVRRRYSVYGRRREGGQADAKQVVEIHSLRCRAQAEFRVAGPVR
jgi:hypothetical protein